MDVCMAARVVSVIAIITVSANAVLADNIRISRVMRISRVIVSAIDVDMIGVDMIDCGSMICANFVAAMVMHDSISRGKAQPVAERHHGDDRKNYELANSSAHNAINRCLHAASIIGFD